MLLLVSELELDAHPKWLSYASQLITAELFKVSQLLVRVLPGPKSPVCIQTRYGFEFYSNDI